MDDASKTGRAQRPAAERLLERLASQLQSTLGKRRYETWFASQTEFRVAAGGELQVLVATPLERDHLQRQFSEDVRAAYAAVCGTRRSVAFRVGESAAPMPTTREDRKRSARSGRDPSAELPPLEAPPASPFEELIVGEANADAVTIGRQVAAGTFLASPLVVWGGIGAGKTQLLQAIHRETRRLRRCRAVYLTAEQFLSGFVEAVHGRGLPSFRHKHRGVELLLLDDVQMLLGKRKTLEELQYTLDALIESGAQVVLGSDRGPSELASLGEELSSRLAAGVAVNVRSPDPVMRHELLAKIADERGVRLEPAAAELIATQIIGGARELSGVVNRLRYETGLFRDSVDVQLAQRVVTDLNRQSTPRVKLADVQDAVCQVFDVDAALLKSAKRTRAASEPRMLAMWLARKYTRSAWSEIGDYFGNRKHSTVISACRRVDSLLQGSAVVELDGAACAVQEALRRVEVQLRTA